MSLRLAPADTGESFYDLMVTAHGATNVYKIVPISKYPADSVHTNIDFVCRDERGVEIVVGADAELTHALSMVMENADVPTPELGEGITLRICIPTLGTVDVDVAWWDHLELDRFSACVQVCDAVLGWLQAAKAGVHTSAPRTRRQTEAEHDERRAARNAHPTLAELAARLGPSDMRADVLLAHLRLVGLRRLARGIWGAVLALKLGPGANAPRAPPLECLSCTTALWTGRAGWASHRTNCPAGAHGLRVVGPPGGAGGADTRCECAWCGKRFVRAGDWTRHWQDRCFACPASRQYVQDS